MLEAVVVKQLRLYGSSALVLQSPQASILVPRGQGSALARPDRAEVVWRSAGAREGAGYGFIPSAVFPPWKMWAAPLVRYARRESQCPSGISHRRRLPAPLGGAFQLLLWRN